MHDGQFETLEEVLEHYKRNVVVSSTVDPLLQYNLDPGLQFSDQNKVDLISFLKTLTDDIFLNNPDFSDPFVEKK